MLTNPAIVSLRAYYPSGPIMPSGKQKESPAGRPVTRKRMGQNPGAGVSVLSGGGNFILFFDALTVGTKPKPVEVDAGNDPGPHPDSRSESNPETAV
jgi:hypothetical protein